MVLLHSSLDTVTELYLIVLYFNVGVYSNFLIGMFSHFPSPTREAQCNVYQPHLPLINYAEEIRPSEVSYFSQKLQHPTEEILNRCKSPWEQEITNNKEGNKTHIYKLDKFVFKCFQP